MQTLTINQPPPMQQTSPLEQPMPAPATQTSVNNTSDPSPAEKESSSEKKVTPTTIAVALLILMIVVSVLMIVFPFLRLGVSESPAGREREDKKYYQEMMEIDLSEIESIKVSYALRPIGSIDDVSVFQSLEYAGAILDYSDSSEYGRVMRSEDRFSISISLKNRLRNATSGFSLWSETNDGKYIVEFIGRQFYVTSPQLQQEINSLL